ncbi:MAG: DUF86 domain-containing protein [Bryobacteraceae bacterium]|nr:DUF86 domain-containing protein [Bryobacteraceae bacterium]
MALDKGVIAARLAALEQYLRLLDELGSLDFNSYVSDPRNYGAAERFLHLAIECIFDVGAHIIASLGLERPNRYADILPCLARAGVIGEGTASRLDSLAGFRNVLVHDYVRLDRNRVYEFARNRLDELRGFAREVAEFLGRYADA